MVALLLIIQLVEPFGVSDYPEATSFGCRSMIAGDSPYAVVLPAFMSSCSAQHLLFAVPFLVAATLKNEV